MGADGSNASIADNKVLVARFFEALSAADAETLFGALSPELSWWIAPSTPLGGYFEGLEQVMGMFMRNGAHFKRRGLRWEIQRMIAEGDHVAVECTMNAVTATGKPFFNYFHFQFEVRDSRICAVREYNDSHHSFVELFTESA